MDSLQFHCYLHFLSPRVHLRRFIVSASLRRPPSSLFSGKTKSLSFRESFKNLDGRCFTKIGTHDSVVGEEEEEEEEEEKEAGNEERPPFDINLAVILAGFAFEAYTTPPENIGRREVDAAGCKTLYLSESFVREIYDGQLFIKLKRGLDLPALDPWGTSDPYVVLDLDGQIAKSKIKWGTKEPKWNEDFIFNIKRPPVKKLKVAAWDANLITPHKRMGNAGLSLECICDGNLHEVLVELEGIGGGGKIELEIRYKCFEEIEEENKWWKIPFISEILRRKEFESVLRKLVESEAVPARQFVEYAFGQLKSLNDGPLKNVKLLRNNKDRAEGDDKPSYFSIVADLFSGRSSDGTSDQHYYSDLGRSGELSEEDYADDSGCSSELEGHNDGRMQTEKTFWSTFAKVVNQNVTQKLGLSSANKFKWDGLETLRKIGLQSRKIAEAAYIDSGLATPDIQETDDDESNGQLAESTTKASLPDIKKATQELLRQTDNVLGAFMVLRAAVSQLHKDQLDKGKDEKNVGSSSRRDSVSGSYKSEELSELVDGASLDEKKAEEMKALFSSAESAMEAWAMLATALGHPSFIKSEFEKICFLDNDITDTQVAIWRDSLRKRLVIAFRGTEQSKWKDLQTDLMLAPAGLNPERIGGDFKQEVQVHSGFLGAYDSVRIRIISLLKFAIGYIDNVAEPPYRWHVYVTGHSLGGALATLLALELASSQLAKRGIITVTMYNFGSPRVGNKRFAEVYNQKVNDSWRVVNHRDIIPTVPRLMGYCHVAQPVYLAAGYLTETLENVELHKDGYGGDVIGEATPDIIISEFMKGEKELIEKILQTEINIFNAIRDGSALMQHMEDFYYITLLESVRSYYQTVGNLEGGVMAVVESAREP